MSFRNALGAKVGRVRAGLWGCTFVSGLLLSTAAQASGAFGNVAATATLSTGCATIDAQVDQTLTGGSIQFGGSGKNMIAGEVVTMTVTGAATAA